MRLKPNSSCSYELRSTVILNQGECECWVILQIFVINAFSTCRFPANSLWIQIIDLQADAWVELGVAEKNITSVDKSFISTPTFECLIGLAEMLLSRRQPLILIGARGVGKSTLGRAILDSIPSKNISRMQLQLSHYSQTGKVQQSFEQKLVKRKSMCFGPAIGKEMLSFIDDINAPMTDSYGCQPLIELIR